LIYSAEAERQVDALRRYYEALGRTDAVRHLIAALIEAEGDIENNPSAGLKAPRPYPQLARAGRMWTKAGRYWIAYTTGVPPSILAVFYDTADIPGRL